MPSATESAVPSLRLRDTAPAPSGPPPTSDGSSRLPCGARNTGSTGRCGSPRWRRKSGEVRLRAGDSRDSAVRRAEIEAERPCLATRFARLHVRGAKTLGVFAARQAYKGRDYVTTTPAPHCRTRLLGRIMAHAKNAYGLACSFLVTTDVHSRAAPNTLTAAEQRKDSSSSSTARASTSLSFRGPGEGLARRERRHPQRTGAPGATLLTKEEFGNFVFRAEFRAHPEVNSALMLRRGVRSRPDTSCRFATKC